ncbi:MAG: efflux RND transporter permease subunit [Patescibacteria group bacterium]|jgi:multidrug efflux pump subunit AcrB|nr:efflux RND transporter permease subunit [Patescibacteria group bacterium]
MEINQRIEAELEKALEKEKKSFFGFFITNYRFTYLVLLIIFVFGFFAVSTLPREANPEIKVPYALVSIVFPGANPSDVEDSVTNKVEKEIKNLDNLKRYTSGSALGFSSIFVEFEAEADIETSIADLKDAVDLAKPELPSDASDPVVSEINFSDFPIVTYSLVGDFSDVELHKIAGFLEDEFETIKNVSRVDILGDIEREFQIIVKKDDLSKYNLSIGRIANTISLNNFNLPSGDIEIDNFNYNIRVKGRFENIDDLSNIVVASISETPIYLRDVATVIDTFKEKTTESRIGFSGTSPKNTISLQIYKKTGGNILDIVDESQYKISMLQEDNRLPENLLIQKTNDNAVFIKEDLKTLGTSALQTMFLILVILMMVLSFRGSLITAMSIPLAFLITFIIIKLQGGTINSLALFALVISLGLMVDNSIIIIEGIAEYSSKHKKNACHSSLLSVWNYKKPIISGTLTTVSAFLPMLLVSGIMGEFIQVLPKTITAALLSSLFVSLVLIPTLSSRFLKIERSKDGDSLRNKKRHLWVEARMNRIKNLYSNYLNSVLPSKKKRRRLLASVWILFVISLLVPIFGMLRVEMFPPIDNDYFVVNIKLPAGSALDITKNVASNIEKIINEIPELDNYVTNLGTSASIGMTEGASSGASSNNSHLASITVNLTDKDKRKKKSFDISSGVREEIKDIREAEVTVEEIGAGPPTGAPIEVRISGNKFKELIALGDEVKSVLSGIGGTINVVDNVSDSSGDFVFSIDRQKASFYGLTTVDVANAMRNAIFGKEASLITIDSEDVYITIKYAENDFKDIEDLKNILIFNQKGESIRLSQVADVSLEPSVLSINHLDGDQVVTINASLVEGGDLQKILTEFDEKQKNIELPEGFSIKVGGEVEDIEQSFREIFYSMILAVILIAFILVLQFNSFRQPLIILLSLPLAIIGVIFGLLILGLPFSFTAFLGIVALSGIVVNDAIVLIDKINKNINHGMEMIPAIIEGGQARMQPILLTTLTTVAGVFPLIFASELWIGLSVAVIFGLSFGSLLTLVVIPILYQGLTDKK